MRARVLPPDRPLTPSLIAARDATFARVGIASDDAATALVIDGRFPVIDDADLTWLLGVPGGRLDDDAGRPIAWRPPADGARRVSRARAVEDGWTSTLAERDAVRGHVRRLCEAGVRVLDPDRVHVEDSVKVEPGATLWPDVVLLGATRIAAGAEIRSGCWIADTTVGAGAVVEPHTVCQQAAIGEDAHVGPMAHLRPKAVLETRVKVGNFVEVKNTTLHAGAKASHLSYLGDAEVGAEANIGAGTITCNYDGYGKHATSIGAGAFVGSNTSLVAPVTIGRGAIVGAGSVITADVPEDALAVERADQRILRDHAPRIRARNARRAGKAP